MTLHPRQPFTGGRDMSEEPFLPLLIKMMGMTLSDNDPTALVALRKANSLLKSNGASWEALLQGKVKIIADPFASMNIPKQRPRTDTPRVPDPPAPPTPQRYRPPPPPPPRPAAPRRPDPNLFNDPNGTPSAWEFRTPNRFAGTCRHCGNFVDVGDGRAVKYITWTTWKTEHWDVTINAPNCPSRRARRGNIRTTDDL